ncbi:hypothetical protein M9H77_13349 [Catharanthus roseus]|uniref:Uncharacterized protein n=1 Tax=Catharanthus roseus TaxID=4058 RepID=A0ACC0BJZ3_CATRO|nr:hypothetical protein M9H77_13349 [Catharanthus roseus]
MESGGGGGSSTSCLMAFGDHSCNNNTLCPMMMMLPMTTTNSHPNSAAGTHNTLFLPPPPPPATSNQNNHRQPPSNSMMLQQQQEDSHHNNNVVTAATAVGCYFMDDNINNIDGSSSNSVKAKIMSHPHYHRLLAAYINCQKIGAPPDVVARLEEACSSAAATMVRSSSSSCIGEDPALDQFMEAYCEMLTKYEQELSKPFKEAMLFLSRIECQFKALSLATSSHDSAMAEAVDRNGSSEEDVDVNNSFVDPQAEDRELKGQLLRKYSGYLGSLKQEFMKKRKKGKLPKEARQQLLDWWEKHYKWPYPSETQKLALAESTGLDQKQINNWFINQRKRHWKPSEDMQFVVMDATQSHYYMDNVLGNPFPMDISPALL